MRSAIPFKHPLHHVISGNQVKLRKLINILNTISIEFDVAIRGRPDKPHSSKILLMKLESAAIFLMRVNNIICC